MKYYELDARKPGDRVVERFFENGLRFIKKIPFTPKILGALKETFRGKPVEVEFKGGWIVVTKTGHDPTLADAGKKYLGDDELTVERVAEAEKQMLEQAGYTVTYVVGEVDE